MNVETAIREQLGAALQPISLEIINESHLHHGHHGSPGTGESHFRITVVAAAFTGRSRVARHRLVNEAVAGLLKTRIHALAITAKAPGEA